MRSEFNVGDKVKIVKSDCGYYNFKAIIRKIDNYDDYLPYFCQILDNKNNAIGCMCFSGKNLVPLKNYEKYFTISIRKHKRINLKFAL